MRIIPTAFHADVEGAAPLTQVERRLIANAADRALCYDLSLRYDLGKARSDWRGLSVGMTVKNLFDKYHVASCFSARACNYGEQRNVGVRVAYLW